MSPLFAAAVLEAWWTIMAGYVTSRESSWCFIVRRLGDGSLVCRARVRPARGSVSRCRRPSSAQWEKFVVLDDVLPVQLQQQPRQPPLIDRRIASRDVSFFLWFPWKSRNVAYQQWVTSGTFISITGGRSLRPVKNRKCICKIAITPGKGRKGWNA